MPKKELVKGTFVTTCPLYSGVQKETGPQSAEQSSTSRFLGNTAI